MSSLRVKEIKAYPTSFPVPEANRVNLGIGQSVKRDAVVVKVTTEGGLVGWGESHHGRAHGAVAHLVNTTLKQLVLGMEATDVVGIWQKIYKMQLASHGMGAGTCLAMSGIDPPASHPASAPAKTMSALPTRSPSKGCSTSPIFDVVRR